MIVRLLKVSGVPKEFLYGRRAFRNGSIEVNVVSIWHANSNCTGASEPPTIADSLCRLTQVCRNLPSLPPTSRGSLAAGFLCTMVRQFCSADGERLMAGSNRVRTGSQALLPAYATVWIYRRWHALLSCLPCPWIALLFPPVLVRCEGHVRNAQRETRSRSLGVVFTRKACMIRRCILPVRWPCS